MTRATGHELRVGDQRPRPRHPALTLMGRKPAYRSELFGPSTAGAASARGLDGAAGVDFGEQALGAEVALLALVDQRVDAGRAGRST